MNSKSSIFRPLKIGQFTARNRIEIAPAGAFLNGLDGSSNQKFMAYMRHLASSGAGIVTIGVSDINKKSIGGRIPNPGNPRLIMEYEEISEIMHRYGVLASMELVPAKQMLTPGHIVATDSTKEEIKELIEEYADAADFCVKAGFDMIMIHGGHGNVPSMFFSSIHNERKDEYGGSFENRCRFGLELLDAIRAKVGDKIAIEYRISGEEILEGSMGVEETIEYAKLIQDKIDILHVSRGLLEVDDMLPYLFSPTYLDRGLNLEVARKFKGALHIPVSVVGGFNLEMSERVISKGDVDMVSMMRTMLADPLSLKKVQAGHEEDIRPCVRCNTCIHHTHSKFLGIRCAVNPLIGRETWFSPVEAKVNTKKVVMIGGGPANLEAARTASKRGHKVIIFEKEGDLGGALRMASTASFKKDMKKYLDWSVRSVMNDKNIEVRLNTEATKEKIKAENADALFIGIGSKPMIPEFRNDVKNKAVYVGDVELGKVKTGLNVVIAGAGFTGLEMALTLANEGKSVTVIDMIPKEQIGADGIHISMIALKKLLSDANVTFICEVKLEDVTNDGAVISYKNGNKEVLHCDNVILSLGVKTEQDKVNEFMGIIEETHVVGDCAVKGGTLYTAVKTGFGLAMEL